MSLLRLPCSARGRVLLPRRPGTQTQTGRHEGRNHTSAPRRPIRRRRGISRRPREHGAGKVGISFSVEHDCLLEGSGEPRSYRQSADGGEKQADRANQLRSYLLSTASRTSHRTPASDWLKNLPQFGSAGPFGLSHLATTCRLFSQLSPAAESVILGNGQVGSRPFSRIPCDLNE